MRKRGLNVLGMGGFYSMGRGDFFVKIDRSMIVRFEGPCQERGWASAIFQINAAIMLVKINPKRAINPRKEGTVNPSACSCRGSRLLLPHNLFLSINIDTTVRGKCILERKCI